MGVKVTAKGSQLIGENDKGVTQCARAYFNPETLFEKVKGKDASEDAKPAYKRNFLLPKGAPVVEMLMDAIREVGTEKWGKNVCDKWMEKYCSKGVAPNDICSMRDGDERDEVDENFAGCWFVNGKSFKRDNIQTASGVRLWGNLDETEDGDDLADDDIAPYSGCNIKILVLEVWAWTHGKKNGISITPLGWKVRDDEAPEMESTGGQSAGDDDMSDDDEDEAPKSTGKAKPKAKK